MFDCCQSVLFSSSFSFSSSSFDKFRFHFLHEMEVTLFLEHKKKTTTKNLNEKCKYSCTEIVETLEMIVVVRREIDAFVQNYRFQYFHRFFYIQNFNIFFSPLSTHLDPLADMVAITESIIMQSNGLGDSTMRFRNGPNQHHFRHRRKSRQL